MARINIHQSAHAIANPSTEQDPVRVSPVKSHQHERADVTKKQVKLRTCHVTFAQLTEELVTLLPLRPPLSLGTFLGEKLLDIKLTASVLKVHVLRAHEWSLVPELEGDVEGEHDWGSKVRLEEVDGDLGGCHGGVSDWPDTNPELRDKD